ncbi:MAG TPA: HAMP domain-containing sensor histidine kinase [Acidothermaceae bacterium]
MSTRRVRLRLPRRTVRLRLTLWYGCLFVLSGAVMLVITNLLVRHATGNFLFVTGTGSDGSSTAAVLAGGGSGTVTAIPSPVGPNDPTQLRAQAQQQAKQLVDEALHQHTAELHQLLIQSLIALAVMSVISIVLGWIVAGRALRPLRTITAAARDISSNNLHERLALAGPEDELKELGDTFDALIARLERSFRSQRQFVANASHELRTPLTLQHALLESALLDPDKTLPGWRVTGERALKASKEQERLIGALLTLARSERGLSHHEPFDLSIVTTAILSGREADANQRGVHVSARLDPAPTTGDLELAERLVANIIDNALRHNVVDGRVEVVTESSNGHAVISVRNTGPSIPPSEIDRLFEPFQRADGERTSYDGGLGLGLSIVQSIATAHDASIRVSAQVTGGLDVVVQFPLAISQAALAR